MNSLERMRNTVAGKRADHLAVQPLFMTFAARHAGVAYGDYVRDCRVLAEAQARMVEDFGVDMVSVCSDNRECVDCGTEMVWFEDEPPVVDNERLALMDRSNLAGLKMPDPLGGGRMHDRVKAVELLKKNVGRDVPVLGWIEGPIAQAAELRGMQQIMVDVLDDEAFVAELFEFVTELEIRFARAQIEAGADVMGIGDAAASLVSEGTYSDLILPYEKRIVDAIRGMGAMVRLHICGDTTRLLPWIATLGVEMVDVDCLTDLGAVRPALGKSTIVLGNLDPAGVVFNGTPAEVRKGLQECYETAGDPFIVAAGCEIPRDTPVENVRAMVAFAGDTSPGSSENGRRRSERNRRWRFPAEERRR